MPGTRGWIDQVAVRRPWRTRVGLGVDGQSLTGAQRLYERAGMQVTMHIGTYEKELRPGKDLSVG